jgi:hypothetical protein
MNWLAKTWASTELSVILSAYAAALSTFLGVLRCIEFFLDRRPKISAYTALTSLPEIGNTITLVNTSKTPANIYWFELVWVKPGVLYRFVPFLRRVESSETPLTDQYADIAIGAHSRYDLVFDEDEHFDWGVGLTSDIYLKISIAARRFPVWFLVAKAGGRRHRG